MRVPLSSDREGVVKACFCIQYLELIASYLHSYVSAMKGEGNDRRSS